MAAFFFFTPNAEEKKAQLVLAVVTLLMTLCPSDVTTATTTTAEVRHSFISSIPYSDMRLAAPVMTSLAGASLRRCGVECVRRDGCRSFNYHSASKTCQLTEHYICLTAVDSDLIAAPGFRYYDVERDGNVTDINAARVDGRCADDAICSPKCTCNVAFHQFTALYLTPDDPVASTVAATNKDDCMQQCTDKPMSQCRGVNYLDSGTQCQHLPFLPAERPTGTLSPNGQWNYHQRKCL